MIPQVVYKFISSLLLSFILFSCSNNVTYYHFSEIKNADWAISDTLFFNLDSLNVDSISRYDISIEITNNVAYPYRNVWLFTSDNLENDTIFTHQQVESFLADEQGRWLGSGFGSLYQSSILYKDNINLLPNKRYQIKIVHGMSDQFLDGIEKIGVHVFKTE